ncbi:hypothetical protein ACFYO9_37680 [Streptomyces sp. NPDC005863]|uniref:hypothetical protein n=1 Tax=Streptomyces sp. NPDC005863 TaxID=3364735 RepID=UPI00367935EB
MTANPIERLDVPLKQVAAVAVLLEAKVRSWSPSDRLAWSLDQQLVTHPEAPVATDSDYPGWAEHIAALQAHNANARIALTHTDAPPGGAA